MSTTAEKITALETALASGTLEVTWNGRTQKYRSADEIIKALTYFKQQLRAGKPGIKLFNMKTASRS